MASLKSSPFCDVTPPRLVVSVDSYWRLETTYRPSPQETTCPRRTANLHCVTSLKSDNSHFTAAEARNQHGPLWNSLCDRLLTPPITMLLLLVRQHPVDQGLLILEVSRSHTTHKIRSHSSGRVIKSVAETCTWQHKTLITDRLPCPRWDSNPHSQQASSRRPTL